eukprot:TRINITY_DN423_c0_g1_i1.p1 TRINITY_DN423_c0_g1~~TRINITY_DN423_c0_g1_i1.p1  ORF type:complete len:422 (-),score=83.93 TRINITY_DN423_c0_g1_i1:136-1401(-)
MRRALLSITALCLLSLFSVACCASSDAVLVFLGENVKQENYKEFISTIQMLSSSVTVSHGRGVPLMVNGQWAYSLIVVLAPADEFDRSITPDLLAKFVDSGRNLFISGSTSNSKAMKTILSNFDTSIVEVDRQSSPATDHFHFHEPLDRDSAHTAIIGKIMDESMSTTPILGGVDVSGVLYRGSCLSVPATPLLRPLIVGQHTAFCAPHAALVKDTGLAATGPFPTLLAVMQARNNARVVLSGSVEMWSNNFLATSFSNRALAKSLSEWAFGKRGLLRSSGNMFWKVAGQNDTMITIKDTIHYQINIEELKEGSWRPYQGKDVQLEFTMLDPHVRTTLTPIGNGTFSTDFTVPDVYGIFTFRVSHHRLGYSSVTAEDTIPVRPFRHTQYARFIPAASPYYIAAGSMLAATVLFAVVFLSMK